MTTPDFPEGFQGSGPMFAAVPDMSDQWYGLAAGGASTFTVENPGLDADGHVTGTAFLDRTDAEAAADADGTGKVWHWRGTTGWHEQTAARAEAERQAEDAAWGGRGPSASYAEWLAEGQPGFDAEWGCEWDCADSDAYQARVEAGLEPEAGS